MTRACPATPGQPPVLGHQWPRQHPEGRVEVAVVLPVEHHDHLAPGELARQRMTSMFAWVADT